MPKILSVHIPDDRSDLIEKIADKVSREYRGKSSPYLLDLIERDIDGSGGLPSKKNENIFVDLCDMLAGYTATARSKQAFEKLKGRVSQRKALEHVLKRASLAFRWLSEHPEAYYDGLRFQYSDEYSETWRESHKSSSEALDSNPILKIA